MLHCGNEFLKQVLNFCFNLNEIVSIITKNLKVAVITDSLKQQFIENQSLVVYLHTMKLIWINHIRHN